MLLIMTEHFLEKKNIKKGRLRRLYKDLEKCMYKELRKFQFVSNDECRQAEEIVTAFGEKTGWLNAPRHIMTHISFYAAMMEESTYQFPKKAFRIMNDITDFFERAGHHYIQNDMSGEVALNGWLEMKSKGECPTK